MSSDNNSMELSRRKILASVGAVGTAGAGVGIGTSALFSDTEEFANNQLTAGQLDLKMDWEEHYSFPQIYDEFSDPTVENGTELDVVRDDPDDSAYVGLPDPENPVVWANDEDDPTGNGKSSLELYFQNTTIEAFPDSPNGDDNPEATFTEIDSGGDPVVQNPCTTLADVPDDLSVYNQDVPGIDTPPNAPARSANGDTLENDFDSASNQAEPLVNLTDIKPGDFGEFTFSTHLCDNPGYLWLQMPGGLTENENSVTEPEAEDDPDNSVVTTDPGAEGEDTQGELADNVQTALWYDDDCNNRINGEPEDLVFIAILDTSSSLNEQDVLQEIIDGANELVERLAAAAQGSGPTIQAGFITFEDVGDNNDVVLVNPIEPISTYVDANGDGKFSLNNDEFIPPAGNIGGGNSPIQVGFDVGREYLNDKVTALESSGAVTDPNKELLLISDGAASVQEGAAGELINEDGTTFEFGNSNTTYESDVVDGEANNQNITIPDPDDGSTGGKARAEATLFARDVDGRTFLSALPASDPKRQDTIDKVDNNFSNDPDADITGDGGDILVRTVTIYDDRNLPDSLPSGIDSAQESEDTILAYASEVGVKYSIPGSSSDGNLNRAEVAARSIAEDMNVETGEDVIFRGTLSDLADLLDPDTQGPDQSEPMPVMLDGNRATADNSCFNPGATHCFGLAWWVAEDVDNRIQSDSVSFDLGFVTEQCRNNTDPGQTFGFGNS